MTGKIVHPDMNANNALVLGQQAITDFKSGWPGTFYEPLSKLFVPMDVKKSMERVYDQELIYARVIGLLDSSRDINFDDELACELAA